MDKYMCFILWFFFYQCLNICKYTIINPNIHGFNIKKVFFFSFLIIQYTRIRNFNHRNAHFKHAQRQISQITDFLPPCKFSTVN